ncbi:MAG: hypothetical protein L6U99_02780 [Clostridium sp.]|nr:MAG: hypothetical protein L6U99_02780 [Clostridium sp.]
MEAYVPKLEDLWYRMYLLSDDLTMKYNDEYGGTIDFNKEKNGKYGMIDGLIMIIAIMPI